MCSSLWNWVFLFDCSKYEGKIYHSCNCTVLTKTSGVSRSLVADLSRLSFDPLNSRVSEINVIKTFASYENWTVCELKEANGSLIPKRDRFQSLSQAIKILSLPYPEKKLKVFLAMSWRVRQHCKYTQLHEEALKSYFSRLSIKIYSDKQAESDERKSNSQCKLNYMSMNPAGINFCNISLKGNLYYATSGSVQHSSNTGS